MGGFKRVRKWVAVQSECSQEVFDFYPIFKTCELHQNITTPPQDSAGEDRGISYLVLGAAGRLQKVALTAVHVQGSHFLLFRWLFWGYGDTAREKTQNKFMLNEPPPRKGGDLPQNLLEFKRIRRFFLLWRCPSNSLFECLLC